ncbi:DNA polymerase III subunit delta' [Pseudomarimonas arenosa]|uniref:DNA-directed DNA polymerase n=1 Tax=Pseudomarimonas arenosa TaxID=2774145 RepID=A0AAW3ZQC2_9GAMM|nr:DNA polymerase III subunit delta' [Pseudomarimonas arenosa]MBD8527689.1 DNA polymerase III subunit delta' [Pseudomarimonas arenosa]
MTPWEQPVWTRLLESLAQQRLAHGLLFCGPADGGQAELAARLAEYLLCSQRVDGAACGTCRSCHLRLAGSHPDLRRIRLLERDDGRLKTEIGVEQIRELSQWLSLTAQFGGAQVALIEPADKLNVSAANALLKTLEEPASNRFLLLVTDATDRLPATVRSRCQRVEVRLPPADTGLQWLHAQGVSAADAERALKLADGNPRRALILRQDGGLQRADEVWRDLGALSTGRELPTRVAQRWMADAPEDRLSMAVRWVCAQAKSSGEKGRLTPQADFHKLAAWVQQANEARRRWSAPLRHELLLTGLLLSWQESNR